MPSKILVTGGVRSGKSAHAESLFGALEPVTYIAAGPTYDDADWQARVAAHRDRRPVTWTTAETLDVGPAIEAAVGPVLVDCVGTWVTGMIDRHELWEAPVGDVEDVVLSELEHVVEAVAAATARVVVVTNEVGYGVVPEHRSGRIFRDLVGTANQRLAAVCDEVHLVVAGRVLVL